MRETYGGSFSIAERSCARVLSVCVSLDSSSRALVLGRIHHTDTMDRQSEQLVIPNALVKRPAQGASPHCRCSKLLAIREFDILSL